MRADVGTFAHLPISLGVVSIGLHADHHDYIPIHPPCHLDPSAGLFVKLLTKALADARQSGPQRLATKPRKGLLLPFFDR